MANVKISALPLYTGNTDGGYFVFNNSGETESFKINKSEVFYISDVLQGYRASGNESNISVVLQPKGNGSFSLQEPDGTTTGGDVRGSKAIDFQLSRTEANQVASGDNSVILGGVNNRVSGPESAAFGNGNFVSGIHSFAIGVNNTINANQVLAAGNGCTANNGESAVFGRGVLSNASYSLAVGQDTRAYSNSSFVMGNRAVTTINAQFARSAGYFNIDGDSQDSIVSVFKQGSIAPSSVLTLSVDGGSGLLLLDGTNRSWQINCRFNLVCTVSGGGVDDPSVGDVFGGEQISTFKKVAGTLTQVGTTSTLHSNADTKLVGTTFTQNVGLFNDLSLEFILPATTNSNTYRGNATLSITELAWE